MRHWKLHHRRPVSIVLVLVLSLLGFFPQLAHASTYVGYTQSNGGGQTACSGAGSVGGCFTSGCQGGDGSKCGTGSALKSPLAGTVTSVSLYTGGTVPNQVEVLTFPAGSTPTTTLTGPPCNGQSGPCLTVNSGQSFTVRDVEGLSGVSTFTFTTISLASPVTVALNQYIAVQFTKTSGGVPPTLGLITLCGSGCASVADTFDSCIDFGTISPAVGTSYTETSLANCGPGLNIVTGATFTLTGTSGQTVTVTQCYGNCGSLAITLANTNSTHTINFNQSITVFYEFQSNLNGFVVNITTNLAKSYSNGLTPSLALYMIPSCPAGNTPFTNQCPGLQFLGGTPQGNNPAKGRLTLGAGAQYAVTNGEWIGIAVTSSLSGLDLNDTNTNVPLFQTSGQIPPTITQANPATSLCAGCKMGLWTWITGNVVTGAGPTPNIGANCSGFLDCIVPNLVFSLCSNQTTQCQNVSALLWAILLSMFFTFFVWKMGANIMPGVRLPFGEIFLLMALVWIFVMSGLTLLFVWVPLFFFFLISLFVGKKTGVYL